MTESFEIRSLDESSAEGTTLVVRGGIDAECSADLRTRVLELSDQGESTIILVMHDVDLLASTGVGTLLLLTETLRGKGQRLLLQDISPAVEQVIGLLNLRSFLEIVASEPSTPGM